MTEVADCHRLFAGGRGVRVMGLSEGYDGYELLGKIVRVLGEARMEPIDLGVVFNDGKARRIAIM